MNYTKEKNRIIILDKSEFNPTHILECGQVFRYNKLSENTYQVVSLNKFALVVEQPNFYEILTNDVNYFENYFDLKTDYSKIKAELNKFDVLVPATTYGYGIRILRQNAFEMIISFIISANNNIKRIQFLVNKLSELYGTNMGDYYAFPTLEQLEKVSLDELKSIKLGFRAKYIFNTIKMLKNTNLDTYNCLGTEELLQKLLSLDGIGPKVADCVALFGYYKMDCFPVDTWIEKVYNSFFAIEPLTNRTKIRKNLVDMFGKLSGFAQQYMFYYKRHLDLDK